MAGTKEIKERMGSIRDTLKITNAMYMISSSKLKKARKELAETEPFFFGLQQEMSRILRHVPDMNSNYFVEREELEAKKDKAVGYLVVTADKGLAGAYNSNVLKIVEKELAQCDNYRLYCVGELGRHYFESHGIEINTQFRYTAQNPSLNRARNIGETLLDDYLHHRVDEVHIIYTRMENAAEETAQMEQLLPLHKSDFTIEGLPADIFMETIAFVPSAEAVMDRVVPEYVVGFIYGALVESFSCEQNARMMAMQSATDSGQEMLRQLSIQYNRARQAAITQEITEIIAGVRAQKKKG
ncbi:MAG: ATP synthase F1 subunit gamma [Lachnospiraceae bacterium]|nr:ATP synthase F1 subunit gamma [Lachnospiraceae bacterium]